MGSRMRKLRILLNFGSLAPGLLQVLGNAPRIPLREVHSRRELQKESSGNRRGHG